MNKILLWLDIFTWNLFIGFENYEKIKSLQENNDEKEWIESNLDSMQLEDFCFSRINVYPPFFCVYLFMVMKNLFKHVKSWTLTLD